MSNKTLIQPSSFSPHPSIDWGVVETEAAKLLSRYLQFDTSNPPGNEALAIQFLANTLRERGFEPKIFEPAPDRANLVARLQTQKEPAAPPCMLYAHADVVPANAADWSVPPFEGYTSDDFVWGRGALDNKGLGIVFLQALTLLKQHAPPLNRDIILFIAADEEASGRHGAAWMLNNHFDEINAEYVWDEGGIGLQQPNNILYQISIAEKTSLTVKLIAEGTPGHASIPRKNNPNDRLVQALRKIKRWPQPVRLTEPVIIMLQTVASGQPFPQSFLYANANKSILWPLLCNQLKNNPVFAALISNTINLTMLNGGQVSNVVPAKAEATLDVRLLPSEDPKAFLTNLRSIIGDLGISVETDDAGAAPRQIPASTNIQLTNTQFYRALTDTLKTIGPAGQITAGLTPGATDSRFFRAADMKAYGFMPMLLNSSELSRIHGIDERISTANLRWGTQIVFETLKKL